MNRLIVPFKYGYKNSKVVEIRPYNTAQEKELLLIPMYTNTFNEDTLDSALEICGLKNIQSFTLNEKLAILYKYREVSVSEDISVFNTCNKCGFKSDALINIRNIVINPTEHSENVIDDFSGIPKYNLDDEASISDYRSIKQSGDKYITKFDFIRPVKCLKCQHVVNVNLRDIRFAIDNMSEKSIEGLYKEYHLLTYFSHYTKQDIDSMYPFERDIFIGLLKETKQELSKGKQ